MVIISTDILDEFVKKHADAKGWIRSWHEHVLRAQWKTPVDVKNDFGTVSILPDNRAVFNVKGNNYRMVIRLNYDMQLISIRFLGTHAEYNRIDATKI